MILSEQYMLPCLNKQLLNIECMGCGFQRSLYALIQGDLLVAFNLYPAIYPLLFLFAAVGINLFHRFKNSGRIINVLAVVSVATIVLNFIIKLTIQYI
jgi:hypothetical protein